MEALTELASLARERVSRTSSVSQNPTFFSFSSRKNTKPEAVTVTAMAERPESTTVISLGGKGSSLSSSSIHAISTGQAQIRLDSSALDRLSPDTTAPSSSYDLPFSKTLSLQESRASLTVLLNHLLLSASVRASLPVRIAGFLNSSSETASIGAIDVTEAERSDVERSPATVLGVCAIMEHELTALSVVADAVAALSCEAMRANVTEAFNLMDSGDGSVSKDKVGVASDMKVLLNGSKLVGKVDCDAVSEIPDIHGSLRKQVKLVHSEMRIGLKSLGPKGRMVAKEVARVLLPLEDVLRDLARSSRLRLDMNLNSIGSDSLRSDLISLLKSYCPSGNDLKQVQLGEDYDSFVHEVYVLSGIVWRIVGWEAMTAFVALEGIELSGKGGDSETKAANAKMDKKNDKKKKKVVLGKGTNVMVQLIKDRLQSKCLEAADSLGLLEKWAEDLGSFLNPKDMEFDSLLAKVKEIVESNESRRLPKLPKGTRDFAKEQMAIREKAFSIIGDVFKRHGATALDTPVFEMRETLTGKYGEDSKLIYDLADQGGELCSLRYDLTVPFARYMAMKSLTSLKRYQIAKVYRRDNPSKGRFREFYQCDFDIAGQFELMGPDFEVVKILTELLDELNIGEYEVKLNHRKLLDGMLEICGVPPEKFRTICSSIDKLDKQPFEKIKKEMVEEKGLSVQTADKIGTFVKERGPPLDLLRKLRLEGSNFLENNSSDAALKELEILFKALDKAKCIDKVVFDLSLARGLDYYTGVIFEAVFKGSTQVGSIGAGGRYDGLIGMFGTKQVPAVGVSLGIERVFTIMEEQLQNQNQAVRATETQVLVGILGDDLSQAAELVSELWSAKLKAEFMANKRVMKHIERAKGSRIPWLVLVGEQESKAGIVKLKDIEASKEEEIPRSNLVAELQKRLGQN